MELGYVTANLPCSQPMRRAQSTDLLHPILTADRPHLSDSALPVADARLRQLTDTDFTPDRTLTCARAAVARGVIARDLFGGISGTPT